MRTLEELKRMKKQELIAFIEELQKTVVKQGHTIYAFNQYITKVVEATEEAIMEISK